MRSRRFPLAARRQKGDAPDHRSLPFMLQSRAGSRASASRAGPIGPERRRYFPDRRPLRRIAPQSRMSGITGRFDRIDNARMIAIALTALTGDRRAMGGSTGFGQRRPAQAGTPTGCGEDRLKPGLQRDAEKTGSSRDSNGMQRRPAQAGTPTGGGLHRLKPGLQYDKTGCASSP